MSHLNNFFTFFPFTFELTWTIFYNVFYNSTNHIFLHGFFGFYIIIMFIFTKYIFFLYYHLSIYLCLYVLSYNLIICLPYWLLILHIQSEKNSKTPPLLFASNFSKLLTNMYFYLSVYVCTSNKICFPSFLLIH
jgi:hypothetical protein